MIATVRGPARVRVTRPAQPRGLVVLGHGAGGGVEAPDLRAAAGAALAAGLAVALVEQPWRVAGRRVAEAPVHLDGAWRAVLDAVRPQAPGVLVVGGRSAGARVACRTAAATAADGVLALAFPLVAANGRSREAELRGAGVPVLVVQGGRDRFGVPAPSDGVDVAVVERADHGFAVRRRDGRTAEQVGEQVGAAVGAWLRRLLGPVSG